MSQRCQRWRARKAVYRHIGEAFDPSRYAVAPVEERPAREFVCEHHYAGSYPAARYRVGLFHKEPFAAERLVGVAVFAVPMNQRVVPRYTGCAPSEGVDLARFVLLDACPGNSESWFLARAFRCLRAERPDIRAVVSYSDPVPRQALDGTVVLPGHIGIIYQASGAQYHGRGSARRLLLDARGRVVSDRLLAKVRREEQGAGYAVRTLIQAGAPAPRPGEDPRAYVERAVSSGAFRSMRHGGNHVYSWRLDRRGATPPQRYPKAIDPVPMELYR